MKKIISFLTMLCVLNVLMAGGLVGYLFATGRMDGAKGRVIVDLIRHQGTPPQLREQVSDILEPSTTTSAPSTQNSLAGLGNPGEGATSATSADDRINFARQALEQQRLALENQAQDLRHRQELLVTLQTQAEETLKKIEDAKKELQPQPPTAESKAKEDSFQKTLALYNELKAKQLKDIMVDGKDADRAAAYLMAMEPSRAAAIVAEFKTPDERTFLETVLDRIRGAGTGAATASKPVADVAAAPPVVSPGAVTP